MAGKKVIRFIKKAIVALLVLVVVVVSAGLWFVMKSWPKVNGNLKVNGLQDKVTVLRDKFGVPNIYAGNDHDLFFAQGYVQAQDRLFQMEINRRIGSGRMSEMIGKFGVGMDKNSRIFGLKKIAEKSYPMLSDDVKSNLQAYCDGINAFIDTHGSKLPVEFSILGLKPEHWTLLDPMSWANFVGQMKAENFSYEIFRAQLSAVLNEKMVNDILPTYDPENPVIIKKELEKYSWKKFIGAMQTSDEKKSILKNMSSGELTWFKDITIQGPNNTIEENFPGSTTFGWASGAFAISGKYTASGKPILANDVHINLTMPNMWYETGLHSPNYDVSGFSIPGVPYILLGHNKNIAWGFANLNPDVEDLYIEKLDNMENPAKYLYMGKWYDIEKKQEIIKVKGGKDIVFNILYTRHGPIVNDIIRITEKDRADLTNTSAFAGINSPMFRDRWKGAEPLALRWTLQDGSLVIQSIALLDRAKNWDDFRSAVSFWDSIGLGFIYSDDQGNIGFQSAAKIPIRNSKYSGIVPSAGWTGQNEWKGYIPFNQLPNLYNPPTGFVATANTKVTTDDYPYLISYDWYHPGYRARILETMIVGLISNKKPITIDDIKRIQGDTFSYAAQQLNSYLAAIQPDNEKETRVLDYVKKWDARFDLNSVGATIYQVWYNYMDVNTFNDELKKNDVWGYLEPLKHLQSLVLIMKNPTNTWFDNVLTENKVETRDDIIKISLKSTIAYLEKNYGADPSHWTFDKLQKVNIKHSIFGYAPTLSSIFNSQQTLPFAGSMSSFDMAYSGSWAPWSYNIVFAASQRHIVSFDNIDKTLSIIPTGESENIFNPHREDQMKLWANMQYNEMPFTKEGVEKSAVDRLNLNPVGLK